MQLLWRSRAPHVGSSPTKVPTTARLADTSKLSGNRAAHINSTAAFVAEANPRPEGVWA